MYKQACVHLRHRFHSQHWLDFARHCSLGSRSQGDRVLLEVADDGPGVPAEVRDKLFDPYFTTKSSGTGLGLAICRRLVEAHGGEVRLAATRPGETRFVIELPLA